METRDGQRVQVKTNDVYIQSQSVADAGKTDSDSPQAASKATESIRPELAAAARDTKVDYRSASRKARVGSQDQQAVAQQASPATEATRQSVKQSNNEIHSLAANVGEAVDDDTSFADLMDTPRTEKAALAQVASSKTAGLKETGIELGGDAPTAGGKGFAASQINETQGVPQPVPTETVQAGRTRESMPERPILRPFEGGMPQQLGNQVVQALNRRDNRIRLQLHPRNLGAIDVNMNLKKNVLSVGMSAETEAVKEILVGQIAELKGALADQGIVVEKIEVTVRQEPNQNFAQQQQGKSQGQQSGNRQGQQGKGTTPDGFVGMNPPKVEADTGLDLMA